jgi:hypothetical protein
LNANTARNLFGLGLLASIQAGCGGGGGSESAACQAGVNNLNPVFCASPAVTQTPDPGPVGQTPNPSPGPGPVALTLAPSSLTIGNCTTRIPFIFSGGVGPYSIFTSDNFNVPASAALPLDDIRSYFFADLRYPPLGGPAVPNPVVATLTVLDSQARSAVATITTPLRDNACPANPLLKVFPETANFRTSEILAFQISGGPTVAATPTVTFADAGVAELVAADAASVTVRAVAAVRATTLMTIATADGQRASVVLNVLPHP